MTWTLSRMGRCRLRRCGDLGNPALTWRTRTFPCWGPGRWWRGRWTTSGGAFSAALWILLKTSSSSRRKKHILVPLRYYIWAAVASALSVIETKKATWNVSAYMIYISCGVHPCKENNLLLGLGCWKKEKKIYFYSGPQPGLLKYKISAGQPCILRALQYISTPAQCQDFFKTPTTKYLPYSNVLYIFLFSVLT